MDQVKRLLIVGQPGAGKGVLSQALCRKLNWQYIDADYGIELKTGIPITEILGETGNTQFRACELEIAKLYARSDNIILNTDAGFVLSDTTCDFVQQHYYIVYVSVTEAVQLERLSMHEKPLLDNVGIPKLVSNLQVRDKQFKRISNITVCTDDGEIENHISAVICSAALENTVVSSNSFQLTDSDKFYLHWKTHQRVELTEQQACLLKQISHGLSAKEIGPGLNISYRTVEGHIARLKELPGCRSSMELVALYYSKH